MLLEGQHVGHDLAGMRDLGQGVDHRDGGVLGQFQHLTVVEDADHDRVDEAGQHLRGVADGLAAPELHLRAGEHQGLAAEFAHGDVEGHAGAGRGPVEHHRQGLAREGALRGQFALPTAPLDGGAGIEDPAQLCSGKVLQIEEMTRAGTVQVPGRGLCPAVNLGFHRVTITRVCSTIT